MPRSLARLSASESSHRDLSSAVSITNIAEFDFRYTQVGRMRPIQVKWANPPSTPPWQRLLLFPNMSRSFRPDVFGQSLHAERDVSRAHAAGLNDFGVGGKTPTQTLSQHDANLVRRAGVTEASAST
jgi:hypothetical protein